MPVEIGAKQSDDVTNSKLVCEAWRARHKDFSFDEFIAGSVIGHAIKVSDS